MTTDDGRLIIADPSLTHNMTELDRRNLTDVHNAELSNVETKDAKRVSFSSFILHPSSFFTSGLGEALWLFVTLRVALSLFALMASLRFELAGPCSWENGPLVHATGMGFRLLGVWQRWDACWYGQIATLGYQPGDPAVAFFPLYPMLMYLAGLPFGGDFTLGGLIGAGVAYIAAMAGLYKLIQHDFDTATSRRCLLYISCFPSAFFFFAPFSESLFLALAVWCLYLARRGRWQWAALPAFYIGLSRPHGCLMALPLAWEFAQHWRRSQRPDRRLRLADVGPALVCILPGLSFMLFIGYSQITTGWTAFQAQHIWGHTARAPWSAIAISWRHIWAERDVVEAMNLTSLLLFSALMLAGIRRIPFSYTLYAAPQLLLFMSRQTFFSPLMSSSRYVLVIFPVFVILALIGRYRRLHESWLILSLLLLGFFLYAFLSGGFVA